MAFFFVPLMIGMGSVQAEVNNARLAADARQMVVCVAPDVSSSEGTLQLFHRDALGLWHPDSKPWPVMFGRGGLAWGRGLHPPQEGPQKTTGDHKNPAGLFKIGFVLGYAPALPPGAKNWPYHKVTDRDAWIDDPTLPSYNHLYTLPQNVPLPNWWEKERMHMDDAAYQWMVLIEHNYDDPMPNAGNSIFFHVRRGDHYRTAGCTTMKLEDIERIIKWLEPGSNAMLVELTRADYERVWNDWHLPSADQVLKGK